MHGYYVELERKEVFAPFAYSFICVNATVVPGLGKAANRIRESAQEVFGAVFFLYFDSRILFDFSTVNASN